MSCNEKVAFNIVKLFSDQVYDVKSHIYCITAPFYEMSLDIGSYSEISPNG